MKTIKCWFVSVLTPASSLKDVDITQQIVAIYLQPSASCKRKPTVNCKNRSYLWAFCTIVVHNKAENSSDNHPSYPPDSHRSDVDYWITLQKLTCLTTFVNLHIISLDTTAISVQQLFLQVDLPLIDYSLTRLQHFQITHSTIKQHLSGSLTHQAFVWRWSNHSCSCDAWHSSEHFQSSTYSVENTAVCCCSLQFQAHSSVVLCGSHTVTRE